ncbi:hypothetical protein CIT26_13130 [Mesorhizobium temperatum]|uniref:Uncharacterized protein n=1 Tax=Mesorhizobium temperatum TaxID=241416 RepID=A0A271LQ68_9HYPH|nr:hypothetical protein CIT26_13130 [Mesorhizobium temperatum]
MSGQNEIPRRAVLANVAMALRRRMISVTAMAPGVVDTTLFTDRKTPEQIAGFAAHATSAHWRVFRHCRRNRGALQRGRCLDQRADGIH